MGARHISELLAEPLYDLFLAHVDAASDPPALFPGPSRSHAEVFPVDIVHRGAFVFQRLLRLCSLLCGRLDILRHLSGYTEVRLIANPADATTRQQPVKDGIAHP